MGSRSLSRIEEDRIIQLIKQCKGARQLKCVHSQLVINGQSQNNFLITKLVRDFTALGDLKHARNVAESVETPNLYLWTAMIRGYSQRTEIESCCKEALQLYVKMLHRVESAVAGDRTFSFALSSVLKACAGVVASKQGMQVHAHVAKYGYQLDIRIQTVLIDFYITCGLGEEAQKIFDRMTVRDVKAWNTMIAGHAKFRNMEAAVSLFRAMPVKNLFTWEAMITGFANLSQMDRAKELFDKLLSCDMNTNAVIFTAMITGYAKCNDLAAAHLVFDKMVERDVASWNAMISAYTKAGCFHEAVELFKLMLKIGGDVKPNQTTVSSVVSACAQLGSVDLVQWIREYIDSRENELMNNHSVTALIDMHSICGDPDEAYRVFKKWKDRDMVCYSSMIAGFGMHGRGVEALKVFSQLQEDGLKPDSICFIVVLSACSHAGLVNEGYQYFHTMQNEYLIRPNADHYMCMVDLLGRAGRISEAYKIIVEVMPPVKPHAGVWGALLSSCRSHNNVEIAEIAAEHLLEVEPENAGNYVLLANMYAKAQMWQRVANVRAIMRSRRVKKPPGSSWIDICGRTHKFQSGNTEDHLLKMMIQVLAGDLKAQGYLPEIEHESDN